MGTMTGTTGEFAAARERTDIAYVALTGFLAWALLDVTLTAGRMLYVTDQAWHLFGWLITYDAGFVRRGLSGELIGPLSAGTGMSPSAVVLAVQIVAHAAFYGAALALVARIRPVPWQLWPALFAPWLFAVPALYGPAGIRKDIVVVATIAAAGSATVRTRTPTATVVAVWLMVPAVLMHEAMLMLAPYLLALAADLPWTRRQLVAAGMGMAAVGAAAAAAVLSTGTDVHVATVCGRIAETVAPSGDVTVCTSKGAVAMLAEGTSFGREVVSTTQPHGLVGLVPLAALVVVGLAPLVWTTIRSVPRATAIRAASAAVAAWTVAIPVFLVANDWGRFLYLHATGVALVCLTLIARSRTIHRPGIGRHVLWALATAVYATTWSIHHVWKIQPGLLG